MDFFGSASELFMAADPTVVAAYLFHILGIPTDVDVDETIRNSQANKKAMGVHCSRLCAVALRWGRFEITAVEVLAN
jgi:hypothetical protein